MHKEKENQSKLIDYQMRFISIGKVIGNISHQWKIPLVRLGALVTHIESIACDKNATFKEVEELIPEIRSNHKFMQNTIDEFYCLYSNTSFKKEFELSKVINDVWGMISAKAFASNVKLKIKDNQTCRIVSYEHSFAHVLIVLMDNVIDVAKKRAIFNPYILIEIASSYKENVKIVIEDNCGGIKQKPIESIFDIHISDKESELEQNGVGLSIVKTLVYEKLGGTINVENTTQGARFIISVPCI